MFWQKKMLTMVMPENLVELSARKSATNGLNYTVGGVPSPPSVETTPGNSLLQSTSAKPLAYEMRVSQLKTRVKDSNTTDFFNKIQILF
jgi:hypothetical protein